MTTHRSIGGDGRVAHQLLKLGVELLHLGPGELDLVEQLAQLELAAMQAAAEQQAALIKSISEELESLDTDAKVVMEDYLEEDMEYVLDEYETLARRSIEEEEKLLIREWFMSMYETMDIYKIYNWILEENGFPTLPHVPLENRVLSYEDVYPILYLKQRLCSMKKHKNIRHLVIDEMQDYSYLQYIILQNMFSCNMTVLGDKAQTVDDRQQDVLRFLPKIFGKEIRKIEMKRSYRNTLEIAEYASGITGLTGIEYLERHGKPVVEKVISSEKEGLKDVLNQVSVGIDKYETAAILTMTEAQAKAAYKYLKQHREDVFYIDRDSSEFCKGITVTTYYLAKGLEFDQVFVLGGDKQNPFYSQFKYISATRALHELYVYDLNFLP